MKYLKLYEDIDIDFNEDWDETNDYPEIFIKWLKNYSPSYLEIEKHFMEMFNKSKKRGYKSLNDYLDDTEPENYISNGFDNSHRKAGFNWVYISSKWVNYITKLDEDIKIDFDDWDDEEDWGDDDDDIKVGDRVKPKMKYVLSTRNHKNRSDTPALIVGVVDGEYERKGCNSMKRTVVEIFYRKDGVKVIRFSGTWPLYVSSEWKKMD